MTFGLVKHNNNSISDITTAGQLASGKLVLIKEQTASSSSSISFVHGTSSVVLDSTYPIYMFKFINIHPQTDDSRFRFQGSIDGGSNYNVSITSTTFRAYHDEGDSATALEYRTPDDQANGTSYQRITNPLGNDIDQSGNGQIFIFSPSSTVFVKHFISRSVSSFYADYVMDDFVAGYFNTTSALNAFSFNMESGNIDSGTIKLYGIQDS